MSQNMTHIFIQYNKERHFRNTKKYTCLHSVIQKAPRSENRRFYFKHNFY